MRAVPITVVGNLTDDPELRFTPSGAAVCKFTVAFNASRYDQAAGKYVDLDPSYYRVTAWRQLAENIAETLTKGSRAIVSGTISERRYETKEGEKRSSWEVTADAVGAELSWATAAVKRMSRSGTPGDDEWNSASRTRPTSGAPVGAGFRSTPPAGARTTADDPSWPTDEPPF